MAEVERPRQVELGRFGRHLRRHAAAQEIGPEKLREGRRVLGIATCVTNLRGQAATRIVRELDNLRGIASKGCRTPSAS